ncbi:hypothetical protein FOZ63_023188 [Perkinsus olseni]|uniref:Rab-GAP TBC domain-containing protein n=1 Tax=Perkinsus olseni TaxID=32597 RepID=A0A7J6R5G4_PEROL|nr:hypothetical protein FOZ63_023188 [Perkinsus olseni]
MAPPPPLPAALTPSHHPDVDDTLQHEDSRRTTGMNDAGPTNAPPPPVAPSDGSSTSSHHHRVSSSSRSADIAAAVAMAQSPHDEFLKGEERTKAKWAKMVKRGISSFIREQPDKFHRRARRGIPAEYRWTVWKACVSHDERFVRNVYWKLTGLGSENEQWGRAIKIDVPRTFPRDQAARTGSQLSEAHLKSLYRILVAYANLNPDVGYCQGMNFVAGLLLLVACPDRNVPPSSVEEEEAFWVFVCLMEYDGLAGFYRENFPLLDHLFYYDELGRAESAQSFYFTPLGRYTHAFDELLARELPDLHDHFTQEGVQPTLYIHQWYLSLFINCLPLQTVFVLWDVIVSDGLPVILSISIALLKVLRPALMQMEFEDIVRFFKTMKTGDEKCDARVIGQLLVRLSGKVEIPDSILESLHMPYDCQDPRNADPSSLLPGPRDLQLDRPPDGLDDSGNKPAAGVAQWLKRVSAQIDASWSELKGGLAGGASSSDDRPSSEGTS